jgi:hypothetical protein
MRAIEAIAACARSDVSSPRLLHQLIARRRELEHGAECLDVERRFARQRHRGGGGLQHPRRDLQVERVDTAHRHRAVCVTRAADDLQRTPGERMERVVDDDRRTMGLMSASG